MGLSPDSPEDEAGIKKAAENSKAQPLSMLALPHPLPSRKALGSTSVWFFSWGPLQRFPHPVTPPPPSKGLD